MDAEVPTLIAQDVEAARRGDRLAFARLFERFAPAVHGVLLARAPAAEVDDLLQEVFLTALERLEALRAEHLVGPWLVAIARNQVVDHFRRRPLRAVVDAEPAREDPRRAEANQALAAIRQLPEAYRETLILSLVEGMSGKEIAAQTGLTPESVRVNLHRGMRLLRARLGLTPEGDVDG